MIDQSATVGVATVAVAARSSTTRSAIDVTPLANEGGVPTSSTARAT
jgi:hypothetical protein